MARAPQGPVTGPGRGRLGGFAMRTLLGGLSQLPPGPALVALRHVARAWAAWAMPRGERALPAGVGHFPARVIGLLGEPLTPARARALLEERLQFLLVRRLLVPSVGTPSAMPGSRVRSHLQVHGAEHLEASLARGRGVIAASTHFGFPQLLGPVLASYGLPSVAARRFGDGDNQVTVSGSVWARAGALQRLRSELRTGTVCVFLVDGVHGDTLSLPFLTGEIRVGLGAFKLAGLSGSPIVPYFGMLGPSRGFTVEFSSALEMPARASRESVAAVVGRFLDRYTSAVRHQPSHIPLRLLGQPAAEP